MDTTRPHRKMMTKEQRFGQRNADSRFQEQLEEAGRSSRRQSWMQTCGG